MSLIAGLALGLGAGIARSARADLPPGQPFVVPKDRAEWDARRPTVSKQVGGDLDINNPASGYSARIGQAESLRAHPDVTVESVHVAGVDPSNPAVDGLLLRPAHAAADRVPLVVLVVDPCPAGTLATATGWDGRAPALVLVEMGFAAMIFDDTNASRIMPLRAALDVALTLPGIDSSRVATVGLGRTGLTALGLMARDPRITCGIVAIESRDAAATGSFGSGGHAVTFTTRCEELAALCAPRPLNLMVGEPLPLVPGRSVGKAIERAMKGTYKVYGKEGTDQSFTLYGEFAGHGSVGTRLQWMGAQEWLDKHFRPQGPKPLGHAPETEPTFDPDDKDVLNLTEHGIAGWAPEMSGRDSTWTWKDGVVACQPKANEYGWLRCSVAIDDFLLQVEWKVPARGNAGIFLRARAVDWVLPPSEENKLRISTLGLTWPSRTGLELQTQDDPGQVNRYSTGSLYRHAAPASNPTQSPGHWNRSTVRARGPHVEVWNNGVQVLDADLNRCGDTLPNLPLKGYFGLQNHGAPAEYRAVRLKRLPPGSDPTQGAVSRSPGAIPSGSTSR